MFQEVKVNVPEGPSPTTGYATGQRWTHWVNLIDGVLLFVAPWVLGYSALNSTAYATALVLGALIAVFGLVGLHRAQRIAGPTGSLGYWVSCRLSPRGCSATPT